MSTPAPSNIDSLVEHMFDEVLDEDERADLLARIQAWETANPGAEPAERVTAWIDLAYEMQAHPYAARRASRAQSTSPRIVGGLTASMT